MQKLSRLSRVLPVGACALALAACGKSQNQQTFNIPDEPPRVDAKNLDVKATSMRLADNAYAKGEYAMAAQLYFRAAELQRDNPEVMIKLGFALFKAGNPADAERIFRAAVAKTPNQPDALRGLAHSLVLQGRAGESLPMYRKALAAAKNDARIYAGMGAALDMVGKHAEARATYQAGLKMAPNDFGLRNNLALSYAMSGDPEKAKAILSSLGGHPAAAQSLSMVDSIIATRKRQVAAAVPAKPDAEPRIEAARAVERRDVAEVPPPARVVRISRKANADLAGADGGEDAMFIRTGRATVVQAEARRGPLAMSFRSDAETPEDAADEVLALLAQAERGPRFVWQEAYNPDQS